MGIEARLFQALKEEINVKSSPFFSELETISGIKSGSWKHVYYGHQRATSGMIEFCCRYFPKYAYWIATGATPDSSMVHMSAEAKLPMTDMLEEIVLKEPVDWTTEEIEIVARNLFGGADVNPALMRLMSDGMEAREKKKLLHVTGLTLLNILKKEPEFWTTTEINYLFFKRHSNSSDLIRFTDFVTANLPPHESLDLALIARQEAKMDFLQEQADYLGD